MRKIYSVHTQRDGEWVVRNKVGKLVSKHGDDLGAALKAATNSQ